jgi:hypothetical protein
MANLSPTTYKYRGTRRRMAGEKKRERGRETGRERPTIFLREKGETEREKQ